MFLGESCENEIRLRNWKESTVCLRAFAAPKAPGTHGDLGLLNLVPRALGIEFGVDEAGQALLLIRLQHVHAGDKKDRAYTYRREQTHGKTLLPLQATQKDSHGCDWEVGERSAQVRLLEDHEHGDAD